ncbi:hypothetical protein ACKI2N_027120 [Cupriavidus sp. 30B13]|uniref:hypothetical protein n=1 Tax=Cupriavidus sp. 30B13 TaxID=3384241 RepID=UPI003B91CA4F
MPNEQFLARQEDRRSGLRALRAALLKAHKELITLNRAEYERLYGPVPAGLFVQIVTEEPYFRWLDPLSRLIIEIDEELEAPEHHDQTCRAVAAATEKLFGPQSEPAFRERYQQALQDESGVIVAHGQLMKVIGQLKQLA